MSQDLLSISTERFSIEAAMMKLPALRNLKRLIIEFKNDKGKKISDDQMLNLERKETIVDREIGNRVNLSYHDTVKEFDVWQRKMRFKKRYF